MTKNPRLSALCALLFVLLAAPASAQVVETVGSRALGMGGAFVAVADDSSATWWNPAGLAAGPFLDISLGRAVTSAEGPLPARRDVGTWLALGTPPFGFSYYRLRVTDIQPIDPTAGEPADREDRRTGVPLRSLSATQIGATLVQTLFPGVHAGTTLKYVRGTGRGLTEDGLRGSADLLDRGEDLEGGEAENRFDLDVGVLFAGGPVRAGGVIRNVTEPAFGGIELERQARVGVAFDGDRAGVGPFMLAIDADVLRYDSRAGGRRVVAVGGEHWFGARRLAIRAGGRFNTAGSNDRAATAGVSIALRSALYVDGHLVRGGSDDDRGWGVAARVSF